MTKEEAIEELTNALDYIEYSGDKSCVLSKETIESAISALKSFEGMTNGEVIQTLFPEVKVEINGFLVRCVFIEHEFTTLLEWWEAPYKAESEVKDGRN